MASRREVDVITWPKRSDLVVFASEMETKLAHFELGLAQADSPISDPLAAYDLRSSAALGALEEDQDYLQVLYGSEEQIELIDSRLTQQRVDQFLSLHRLSPEEVQVKGLPGLDRVLEDLPLIDLHRLLVDWTDIVELHRPPSADREPDPWEKRSTPDACFNFHYQALGLESAEHCSPRQDQESYELFRGMVDVDLASYGLGHHLCWVYFHRAEFPDFRRPEPRAWSEAGLF